jgi:uncharacterized membrane protein YeaQ/YmgE (transglycosylase-associated protein family)
MKPVQTLLIIVLIISGFLPLPFLVACLFLHPTAAVMLQLGDLTPSLQNLLMINGAYMLSFILLFWVSAAAIIRSHPYGTMLSLVLGIITLMRGLLLQSMFNFHETTTPFLAIIATADGAVIILLSLLAKRKSVESTEHKL